MGSCQTEVHYNYMHFDHFSYIIIIVIKYSYYNAYQIVLRLSE